jgi:transposase-like protein
MPWLETAPMDQRERFIDDHFRGLYTMTELCARDGISRKSGYKWLERFEEGGRAALRDRSRAPHHCPHRIAPDVAQLICAARRAIRAGDRRSSWTGSRRGTPASPGPPSARRATCWRAGAWSRNGAGAGRTNTRVSCPRRPPSPTLSGPPISRASSGRGMGAPATP